MPFYASWFLSLGAFGFVFLGDLASKEGRNLKRRRKTLVMLIVSGLAASVMMAASCGGGSTTQQTSQTSPSANSYTISVIGSSSSGQISTEIVVSLAQGN